MFKNVVTADVFQLFPLGVGRVVNAGQPLKHPDRVVTPEVFIEATDVKDLHEVNVEVISVQRELIPFVACPNAEVSTRLAQPENVVFKVVTLLQSIAGIADRALTF